MPSSPAGAACRREALGASTVRVQRVQPARGDRRDTARRRPERDRSRSLSGAAATGPGSWPGARPRTWRPCGGSRTSSAPSRSKAPAERAKRRARDGPRGTPCRYAPQRPDRASHGPDAHPLPAPLKHRNSAACGATGTVDDRVAGRRERAIYVVRTNGELIVERAAQRGRASKFASENLRRRSRGLDSGGQACATSVSDPAN